jgi:NAD(P)-binding Rossmann-like domain
MQHIETDYLVVGAGATGLAFADTLVTETQAHVTLVDRHGKPGGHWNDAYAFVGLHQPSAFYGVNSLDLGNGHKDTVGVNQGLYELASGPEVSSYFDKVMRQKLLPTGRVAYHPMCNHLGDGLFESVLTGAKTQVHVRKKLVDATYFAPSVPATHTPRFKVAPGAWLVPPGALPQLWQAPSRPAHFVILGAGKTAMDVGVWLLQAGVAPSAIHWVVPRDSWLVNRLHTQPGQEFFEQSIGGQADQMQAMAAATSIDDLFLRLEACGTMLRIDPQHTPTMFHYATISRAEVDVLRAITQVIRMGRVQAVEADGLLLDQGRVSLPTGTLCIDCTASAVEKRPPPPQPVFSGKHILLHLVRIPFPGFSAALTAYVEAHMPDDDGIKNKLCTPVPFPDSLKGYAASTLGNMMNSMAWSQDETLRAWIRASRLDGFGKVMAGADRNDAAKQATLARLKAGAMAAAGNLPKLLGMS